MVETPLHRTFDDGGSLSDGCCSPLGPSVVRAAEQLVDPSRVDRGALGDDIAVNRRYDSLHTHAAAP